MTGRLTSFNERVITQARELAELHGIEAIRKHTGQADGAMALSSALGEAQYYLRELARIINRLTESGGEDQGDELDSLEPYCATCGSPVGVFLGHGDGWHHWRGESTVANPIELYDAGHEAEVAWRPAGGR